uniref:Uncharacterized protein n=1 Tax=Thermodesulfobacterium geofontis TaxID=1295609 RepID=A0A7V4N3L6_9BACT
MKLSLKLKTLPTRERLKFLKSLPSFGRKEWNYYIDLYWKAPDWELKLDKPPKEFRGSGTKLERLAGDKAWQIVKSVRNKKKGAKNKASF